LNYAPRPNLAHFSQQEVVSITLHLSLSPYCHTIYTPSQKDPSHPCTISQKIPIDENFVMFFACETKLAICSTFYFFNRKFVDFDFLNRRHSQSAVKKCVGLNSARTRPNLAHFSQQEVVFLNHTSISHYRLTPTKNTHVSSLFHSFARN